MIKRASRIKYVYKLLLADYFVVISGIVFHRKSRNRILAAIYILRCSRAERENILKIILVVNQYFLMKTF